MASESLQKIDFSGVGVDPMKLSQLKDYINFLVVRQEPLSYLKVSKNVGLSQRQWEIFRTNNMEMDLDWVSD
jgi:hypothetical protein